MFFLKQSKGVTHGGGELSIHSTSLAMYTLIENKTLKFELPFYCNLPQFSIITKQEPINSLTKAPTITSQFSSALAFSFILI